MATTEQRVRQLVSDNLEVDGQPLDLPADLNISLIDAGVSSLDLVAFAKVVAQEFNISFTPEDCASVNSVRELIRFIDAGAG